MGMKVEYLTIKMCPYIIESIDDKSSSNIISGINIDIFCWKVRNFPSLVKLGLIFLLSLLWNSTTLGLT